MRPATRRFVFLVRDMSCCLAEQLSLRLGWGWLLRKVEQWSCQNALLQGNAAPYGLGNREREISTHTPVCCLSLWQACKCLDPDNQSDSNCIGTCKFPNFKGDSNCDDENKLGLFLRLLDLMFAHMVYCPVLVTAAVVTMVVIAAPKRWKAVQLKKPTGSFLMLY